MSEEKDKLVSKTNRLQIENDDLISEKLRILQMKKNLEDENKRLQSVVVDLNSKLEKQIEQSSKVKFEYEELKGKQVIMNDQQHEVEEEKNHVAG